MAKVSVNGSGTKQSPWVLKTPSGSSEYQMYKDESLNPPVLVCKVGKTELRYDLLCLHKVPGVQGLILLPSRGAFSKAHL
jgi:hypothetical protein